MTRPVATAIITCARPDGLVAPLECMAKQDFAEPWELVIVNWGFGEQDELVRALWKHLRPDVPLKHVPLLPPLPIHGKYSSWHMGTTFNTAWTHAEGEFCVGIEDFWVFGPTWLQGHVREQRELGQHFIVGYNHDQPAYDETAPWHYGVEAINVVNFSHQTKLAWQDSGRGAPEWPTRYPETTILPFVFLEHGMQAIRRPVHAWHLPHYPDGSFGYIMQKAHYESGGPIHYLDGSHFDGTHHYLPVEQISNSLVNTYAPPDSWAPYRRNVRDERIRLGYWV